MSLRPLLRRHRFEGQGGADRVQALPGEPAQLARALRPGLPGEPAKASVLSPGTRMLLHRMLAGAALINGFAALGRTLQTRRRATYWL